MYHVYEVVTQNEGIDWHAYAESQKDARTMVAALNDFMSRKCRNLVRAIDYQSIAPGLKSQTGYGCEKQEVKSFFERFHRPLIKQHGVIGGYAVDYRKCSVREKSDMPYDVMLSYLDMAAHDEFFILDGIEPVYVAGNEINIQDYETHIKLTFAIDKRYEYENEALVGFAGIKLGFRIDRVEEETGLTREDVFFVELTDTVQLCQFLNYLPYAHIYSISCS